MRMFRRNTAPSLILSDFTVYSALTVAVVEHSKLGFVETQRLLIYTFNRSEIQQLYNLMHDLVV